MTLGRHRYDHVIVGAGVGGSVLAGRLAAAGRSVLLLDAGRDAQPATGSDASFFTALADPDRSFADVFVSAARGTAPIPYRLGRGIGGGAQINGMLATPALRSDIDRWAVDHDLATWAWPHIAVSFDDHLLPLEQPNQSEWGSVDRALVDAAIGLGHAMCPDYRAGALGVGPGWFTRRAGRRVTPADVYLPLGGTNLTVRTGVAVAHVVVVDSRATGVVTDTGELIEADEVVLAAGAFETATLLRRSVQGGHRRHRVVDHPSIRFGLRLREPNDPTGLVASTLLRWSSTDGESDLQLLPLNHLGSTADPHLAGLMVGLMNVRSVGSIAVDSSGHRARVELNLLADDQDRRRMREAARHMAALVCSDPFAEIVEDVFIDDRGTTLDGLALDDDDALDRWMLTSIGDTFHAGSTCPMGGSADRARVVDSSGHVIGTRSLRVCDASMFPDLPTANPYLPLVMVAEQIALRTLAD
ncbi:MAG: GMC family oxidoreductase [Ilumatobacteraceae bacterium]